LVNLGCGLRFDRDWINFDMFPADEGVRKANFLRGIPLASGSADVVYHSHVLEHLELDAARDFLKECLRVLRPGGIIRVVVPDLEQIVREYLRTLDGRRSGSRSPADHQWMCIELLDQMCRTRPGGEFAAIVERNLGNDAFVAQRLGMEGPEMIRAVRARRGNSRMVQLMRLLRRALPAPLGQALGETLFRTRGEVHKWAYDECSLADLLQDAGFRHPRHMTAMTSGIPSWPSYELDADLHGSPWKAISLYMEAVRPPSPPTSSPA
jgi:predicted SAM-dependent methyltransferase